MTDLEIDSSRLWLDGCWDFFHPGHAGAIFQARLLGDTLIVGCHPDEEIRKHKGPPVMPFEDRIATIEACRWVSYAVSAPYVTQLAVINEHKCMYVVHGDDITTDATGKDTYAELKLVNRFKECKRTLGISTTDLVGRMLIESREHHIPDTQIQQAISKNLPRIKNFAKAENARDPWVSVFSVTGGNELELLIEGHHPKENQKVGYLSGTWDLFGPGHIECLKEMKQQTDFLLLGIERDSLCQKERGFSYPIMNLIERTLCLIQCRYVDAVIIGLPPTPNYADLFSKLTSGFKPNVIYLPRMRYEQFDVRSRLSEHFDICPLSQKASISEEKTAEITKRILRNRQAFEERQRRKLGKSSKESELLTEHRRRGKFFVIEGLDRSGKSTLAEKLVEYISGSKDLKVERIAFPYRNTSIGKLLDQYLKKETELEDHAVHLLFSANRWEMQSKIRQLLEDDINIVCDRYLFSGIAFSVSKGMDLSWCKTMERGQIIPDQILFLNTLRSVERDGFGEERYETPDFQKTVLRNFNKLASEMDSSVWIDIDANLSKEEVLENSILHINEALNQRMSKDSIHTY